MRATLTRGDLSRDPNGAKPDGESEAIGREEEWSEGPLLTMADLPRLEVPPCGFGAIKSRMRQYGTLIKDQVLVEGCAGQ